MCSRTFGIKMRPASLLVIAGGVGSRLQPAVSTVPKPLAPVVNRPYLHYLLDNWLAQGVTSLIFLLHHQAGLIETFLEREQDLGRPLVNCSVRILTEPQPLGTGGAIAYAVQQLQITGSFLATNADTWLGSGIKQISEASEPAMAVVRVDNSDRYGKVRIERNVVVGFDEKRNGAGAAWINAGLYHLNAAQFQDWDGRAFSLEREMFPALASTGKLSAVPLETEFIDIGVPKDYFRFCSWIESGKSSAL